MLRFTIRDLLWLMAVVALACAWSLDHIKARVDWQSVYQREAQLHEQITAEPRRTKRAEESNEMLRSIVREYPRTKKPL